MPENELFETLEALLLVREKLDIDEGQVGVRGLDADVVVTTVDGEPIEDQRVAAQIEDRVAAREDDRGPRSRLQGEPESVPRRDEQ